MIADHTYYLPKQRRVIGPRAEELAAYLFAVWMREPNEPELSDGVSVWTDDSGQRMAVTRGEAYCEDGRRKVRYRVEVTPRD